MQNEKLFFTLMKRAQEKKKSTHYYRVKIRISSDSGVGPYSEEKWICNCVLGKDTIYKDNLTVQEKYHNGIFDCKVDVIDIEKQKAYYY